MAQKKPGPKKGSEGALRIANAHSGSKEHDRRGGFAANPELARLAGQRGAATLKARRGEAHFQSMGKLGGNAVKTKYGPDYYRAIGQMGGRSRWDAQKAKEEE